MYYIYVYNLWQNYAILNDIDSKRTSSRCFQGHNLHPRETGLVHDFSHIFTWSIDRKKNTVFSKCAHTYSPDYVIFMRSTGCVVHY